MLVRHLCFNQNSYLKTENLLFLHIRLSRSKSKLQKKISVLIFANNRVYVYSYTYSHICIIAHTLTRIYTLTRTYTYSYVFVYMCVNHLFKVVYYYWKLALAKLLFLGIPKYLVKNNAYCLDLLKNDSTSSYCILFKLT